MQARFDYRAWYQALQEEVERAEVEGIEAAVQATAARFRDIYDREQFAATVEDLRRRYRIEGRDAQAAFSLVEAFYWDQAIRRQPLLGRLKRWLSRLLGYHYPQVLSLSPEQVVFPAPMGDHCPLLAACNQDLDKCWPFCQAHLHAGILSDPLEMLLVEAVGPSVRWEINEYRSRPDERCYYQIVSVEDRHEGEKRPP
ncbi:MAG: hypothetical protein JXA37_02675 [Chloroflexia bacterium]|nr:hypothetical protein [Chloroflexia bacterium]